MYDNFKAEALANGDDLYVQKDLMIICISMQNAFLVNFDKKFTNQIIQICRNMLKGYPEDRNAAMEVILNLTVAQENIIKIFTD